MAKSEVYEMQYLTDTNDLTDDRAITLNEYRYKSPKQDDCFYLNSIFQEDFIWRK